MELNEQFIFDFLFSDSSSSDSSDSEEEDVLVRPHEKRRKIEGYVSILMPNILDDGFQRHFRLTRTGVELFMQELEMPPMSHRGRPPVPYLDSFLLTLWFLANRESYRSMAERFGVSISTAHKVVNFMMFLIYEQSYKWIIWPVDDAARRTVFCFGMLRTVTLSGAFAILDGSHVGILQPHKSTAYYNRKKFNSMQIQGICDSGGYFIDVFCGWPGSVHDARVWRNSPIAEEITTNPNKVPDGCFILADSAYPLTVKVITPFKDNGHLTQAQKKFNKVLSSSRVVIEQAFGRLKGSFRKLKGLEITDLTNFKHIVFAACSLHNFCVKHNIELDYDDDEEEEPRDPIEEEDKEIRRILRAQEGGVVLRNRLVEQVAGL